jgi:predicted transcriptional regulator
MVSTFPSDDAATIEKSEFILQLMEDIKSSSESLVSRTKEVMNVILQNENREEYAALRAVETPKAPGPGAATKASEEWLQRLIRIRALRDGYFPKDLFCDPAWDMVLDLTLAHLAGKQISVSSLCVASGVPATTALRRIDDLVDRGLAKRLKDQSDGRRVFVALTDEGLKRITGFLDALSVAARDLASAKRTPSTVR